MGHIFQGCFANGEVPEAGRTKIVKMQIFYSIGKWMK
jgi:hypothetical protein